MAAAGAPIRVPVAVACRVLGLSTQGYYKWLKDPVSRRDYDDAHVINRLRDLHADDPTLGYRFLTDELADEHNIKVGKTGCTGCAGSPGSPPVTTRNGPSPAAPARHRTTTSSPSSTHTA